MGVCGPLRELTELVEGIEESAGEVTSVDLPDRLTADAPFTAEVELRLPIESLASDDGATLRSSSVAADGSVTLSFETTPVVPSMGRPLESELLEATIDSDGKIRVLLVVSVPAEMAADADCSPASASLEVEASGNAGDVSYGGRAVSRDLAGGRRGEREQGVASTGETAREEREVDDDEVKRGSHEATTERSRDVPPFRDTALLTEIYESCDTFAEMADAIEMDVTPETVRRYMIDNGIHEPTPYNTDDSANTTDDADPSVSERDPSASDRVAATSDDEPTASDDSLAPDGEQTPVVLADGIGLTDEIDVDTLVEAVRNSRTIYEVKQEIGLDREDAVETLREYDLLDLVVTRLSDDGRNEVTREEVVERLRGVSATR